jgi:hypothetical protein
MVATAVGFFTQQDVSPDGGSWSGPECAQAEEVPKGDDPSEPAPQTKARSLQIASAENKQDAAKTGLRVISGTAGSIMEESSPQGQARADEVSMDAEDAPEQVRETEQGIVNALEELTGQFSESEEEGEEVVPEGVERSSEKTDAVEAQSETPSPQQIRQSDDPLRSKYSYSDHGRRDPFRALIADGEGDTHSDKLSLDEARLVGILWGGRNNVALLEDFQKVAFCLKEGDRVQDGRLVTIRSNSVVFSRYRFGRTETVVLELEEKKAGGS